MSFVFGGAKVQAADLKVGDPAPDFSLKGSDGKTYELKDFKGKQAVVLAWFPKAFTGGCTKECKSFQTDSKAIKAFDVAYFTASVDTPEKNADFAESLGVKDYAILADPTRETAKAYGVRQQGTRLRESLDLLHRQGRQDSGDRQEDQYRQRRQRRRREVEETRHPGEERLSDAAIKHRRLTPRRSRFPACERQGASRRCVDSCQRRSPLICLVASPLRPNGGDFLYLPCNQFLELRLAQHRHAQFFGFVELAAGLFAGDDVVGVLRDARCRPAAVLRDQLFDFVAAVFGQRAGDDQRLAGQRARLAAAAQRFGAVMSTPGALQIGDRLAAEIAVQEIRTRSRR